MTFSDKLRIKCVKFLFRKPRLSDGIGQGVIIKIMVGDSILFEYLRSARPIWDEFYGKRNAVNISSSGDKTQHMLWHFQDGGLDGMKDRNPKVVVILIGTNNRGKPENAGQDTAAGILARRGPILPETRATLPSTSSLGVARVQRSP